MQTLSSNRKAGCHETNLVVQAARAYLSGGQVRELQAALAQSLKWAEVERTADYHSIMPLVACALKQNGGGMVPLEIRERLQQRLRHTAQSNLVLLQEWCSILQAFETEGISVISLKGPALTLLAYQNIALREFVDLDLLIRPGDLLRARDLLVREGYQLCSSLTGDAGVLLRSRNRQLDFANDERRTFVDLHWGALHEMFSFQLPVDQLFVSARVEQQEGIKFLSLSPEHLLLYLCAHGTKHCWLGLRWLCDVACHLRSAPNLDWALCIRQAKAAKCDLVLKHSLLLAQQVLGTEIPPTISRHCEDPEAQSLADRAERFMFRGERDIGYGEAMHYHLAFATGWRDLVHLVVQRLFVPDVQDWKERDLRGSLRFLYYAAKPLRFMFARAKATLALW